MRKSFFINQLHYFNYGSFFAQKFMFVINLLILVKVYELKPVYSFVLGLGGLLGIQLLGIILDRTDVIDSFNSRTNRGIIREMKK